MSSNLRLFQSVQNQEFRRWFGDSKVANDDGSPKVVFHGTLSCFLGFRARKRNPELGFHFGTLAQAEFFAGYEEERRVPTGSNIRPVYLRIENSIRLPDLFERGRRSAENVARWLYRDGLIAKHICEQACCAGTARQANDRVIRAIRNAGYDGIVYENDQEGGTDIINDDSYVAFEPGQIRSIFHVSDHPSSADTLASNPSNFTSWSAGDSGSHSRRRVRL
jgi:hypothetical protein